MGLPGSATIADIGCGNGKYFAVRKDLIVLGSDRSFGLAAQAQQRCISTARSDSSGMNSKLQSNGFASELHGHTARDRTGNRAAPSAQNADVLVADGLNLPYKVTLLWVYFTVNMVLVSKG